MAETTDKLNTTNYDALTPGTGGNYRSTASERRDTETNTGSHPEETEHLKAQIAETRSQMGETIDALQERLSFSNISEQVSEHVGNAIKTAKDTVYDATIGKAVGVMKNMGNEISDSGIVRTARNNPFPLILIGLGAGLLAYNSFSGNKRRSSFRQRDFGRREFDRPEPLHEGVSFVESGPGFDVSNASGRTAGLTNKVTSAANSAYEGVSNAVDSAYSSTRDLANKAYTKAGEYGNTAYDTYDHYLTENPLAVGAAAFALGAVVGLAIPATQYEGELMGDARDELLRKAQDTGSNLLNKTRRIVDEAAQTVSKETQAIIH